jgi:hypothetical protein
MKKVTGIKRQMSDYHEDIIHHLENLASVAKAATHTTTANYAEQREDGKTHL